MEKKNLENEVSKYLDALVGDYQKEICNPDADYIMSKDDMLDFATHFVNWQRDQILNCNATLQRAFELGKIEMKQQILKAMDLGEPPYLISVEKAYYDVKKLLED